MERTEEEKEALAPLSAIVEVRYLTGQLTSDQLADLEVACRDDEAWDRWCDDVVADVREPGDPYFSREKGD